MHVYKKGNIDLIILNMKKVWLQVLLCHNTKQQHNPLYYFYSFLKVLHHFITRIIFPLVFNNMFLIFIGDFIRSIKYPCFYQLSLQGMGADPVSSWSVAPVGFLESSPQTPPNHRVELRGRKIMVWHGSQGIAEDTAMEVERWSWALNRMPRYYLLGCDGEIVEPDGLEHNPLCNKERIASEGINMVEIHIKIIVISCFVPILLCKIIVFRIMLKKNQ